jgi:para-aminobenzoate synthetase component 1
VRRGIYCGAIGWLGEDGSLELNIAIRTVVLANGMATVGAGGGITALSDPSAEYQESLDKANALLAAIAEAS